MGRCGIERGRKWGRILGIFGTSDKNKNIGGGGGGTVGLLGLKCLQWVGTGVLSSYTNSTNPTGPRA